MATPTKRSGGKTSKSGRAKAEELTSFFEDVEALMGRLAHLPDEGIAQLRERLETSLASARSSVEDGVEKIVDSTTGAAKAADDFVQEHPWRAIGVAAVACLAIGALLRRE
jgi:ElaB/YqjD/DUF883 family membrane-anchored ribosome-binding protein